MDKILTVVIPTYNMEKYLDKCLTSLIIEDKELMRRLEVLVIIDGAKDRSSEIAHTYQSKYPYTFKVIDKENGNYGSCVNRGLKEATGKYIKILDADDYFDTNTFQEFLLFISKYDVDLILSNCYKVNEEGVKTGDYTITGIDSAKALPIVDYDLLLQPHQTVTYKTENLLKISYKQTEGYSYTDSEWLHLPMTTVHTFVFFGNYLYLYLIGREGQTVNPQNVIKQLSHQFVCIMSMIDSWNNYKQDDKYKGFLEKHILTYMLSIYNMCIIDRNIKNEVLQEFDNTIKEKSKYLYDRMNSFCVNDKYIRYHHIYNWRKSNNGLPPHIRMARCVLKEIMNIKNEIL